MTLSCISAICKNYQRLVSLKDSVGEAQRRLTSSVQIACSELWERGAELLSEIELRSEDFSKHLNDLQYEKTIGPLPATTRLLQQHADLLRKLGDHKTHLMDLTREKEFTDSGGPAYARKTFEEIKHWVRDTTATDAIEQLQRELRYLEITDANHVQKFETDCQTVVETVENAMQTGENYLAKCQPWVSEKQLQLKMKEIDEAMGDLARRIAFLEQVCKRSPACAAELPERLCFSCMNKARIGLLPCDYCEATLCSICVLSKLDRLGNGGAGVERIASTGALICPCCGQRGHPLPRVRKLLDDKLLGRYASRQGGGRVAQADGLGRKRSLRGDARKEHGSEQVGEGQMKRGRSRRSQSPVRPQLIRLCGESWLTFQRFEHGLTVKDLWHLRPENQQTVRMFGKEKTISRRQKAFGYDYYFAHQTAIADPFPDFLEKIRLGIVQQTGVDFNGALLNFYTSNDHIGLHSDKVSALVPDSPIATLSIGGSRVFRFRNCKDRADQTQFNVHDGDLLIMHGATQTTHKHEVRPPKKRNSDSYKADRVSITLRVFRHG